MACLLAAMHGRRRSLSEHEPAALRGSFRTELMAQYVRDMQVRLCEKRSTVKTIPTRDFEGGQNQGKLGHPEVQATGYSKNSSCQALKTQTKRSSSHCPIWWRRGESNPRPKVFHLRDYMLSRCFSVTLGTPNGRVSKGHPVKISASSPPAEKSAHPTE